MGIQVYAPGHSTFDVAGAWFLEDLPDQMVIELADHRFVTAPLRLEPGQTDPVFQAYEGAHPRKRKGTPVPEWQFRFYGMVRASETASEKLIVRLTPTDLRRLTSAAEAAGKAVSEFVREWVWTL